MSKKETIEMHTYTCDHCESKAEFGPREDGRYSQWKDCASCGAEQGMRSDNTYRGVQIRKYGPDSNPMSNVYAQVANRPRSGSF